MNIVLSSQRVRAGEYFAPIVRHVTQAEALRIFLFSEIEMGGQVVDLDEEAVLVRTRLNETTDTNEFRADSPAMEHLVSLAALHVIAALGYSSALRRRAQPLLRGGATWKDMRPRPRAQIPAKWLLLAEAGLESTDQQAALRSLDSESLLAAVSMLRGLRKSGVVPSCRSAIGQWPAQRNVM